MVEALQGEIIERKGLLKKLEGEISGVAKKINSSSKDLQMIAGGKSSKVIGELQKKLEEQRRELSSLQAHFASISAKQDSMKDEVGRLK